MSFAPVEDVDRGVGVRVHPHAAVFALEYRLAFAVVLRAVSATGAGLAGVCGVHFDEGTSRELGFVCELFVYKTEVRVVHAVVEFAFRGLTVRQVHALVILVWFRFRLAGHVRDFEGFQYDDVVFLDETCGRLVRMVHDDVARLAVQASDFTLFAFVSFRCAVLLVVAQVLASGGFHLARLGALAAANLFVYLVQFGFGQVDECAVGQCELMLAATVDAGHAARGLHGEGLWGVDECERAFPPVDVHARVVADGFAGAHMDLDRPTRPVWPVSTRVLSGDGHDAVGAVHFPIEGVAAVVVPAHEAQRVTLAAFELRHASDRLVLTALCFAAFYARIPFHGFQFGRGFKDERRDCG